MPEQSLAAELTAIRADLAELRRWVRSNPSYVDRELPALIDRVRVLKTLLPASYAPYWIPGRLAENLSAGGRSILACPAALEGYLAGADWELAVLIGRLERGEGEAEA
jgi:hypothetical protein